MNDFLYTLQNIWNIGFVRFIVYLLLAFVAAKIVSGLVTKLLKLLKLDEKLDKWGINEGSVGTSLQFVGKLVYLIVFLSFASSALEAIGINAISSPINRFVSVFIEYLPNIITAAILVYVGVLVAKILGQIVSVLLKKTKIDSLVKKGEEEKVVLLSDVLTKILVSVIVLVAVVAALGVLNIEAISAPAVGIVNAIFDAIPSVALAVVVVAVGLLVANIACDLLYNVLVAVGFDSVAKKVLPQLKTSAAKVIVNVVKTFIIIFIVAQGLQVLGLSVLTMVAADLIAWLPLIVKAALILLAAIIGANLLESVIVKSCPNCAVAGKAAKAAVFTVAGFMILSQLGIASVLVEKAFVITFAAIAVTFALAFGLGGRDFAKRVLDKVGPKEETEEK